MRGPQEPERSFISLINVEQVMAWDHPIRRIQQTVDEVRRRMGAVCDAMDARQGRPWIPPEQLLKAQVLQALFSVRSDRQLCARLQTDLMFRWFLDLGLDEKVLDASSFSQNQQRLLAHEVGDRFFVEVVNLARAQGWVSDEHFSVDGTLIEGWASMKSFRPKSESESGGSGPGPGNPWMDFHGEKRSNDTHASTTDPDLRLARQGPGKESRWNFGAHAAMENRQGLCVSFELCDQRGPRREPAHPQTHRGNLWLDQNHRLLPQKPPSRHRANSRRRTVCGRHAQLVAHGQAGGGPMKAEPTGKTGPRHRAGSNICPAGMHSGLKREASTVN